MGFFSLLTVLFIALKLTGVVEWSWLLVLSPMIIAVVLGTLIVILSVAIRLYDDGYWKK